MVERFECTSSRVFNLKEPGIVNENEPSKKCENIEFNIRLSIYVVITCARILNDINSELGNYRNELLVDTCISQIHLFRRNEISKFCQRCIHSFKRFLDVVNKCVRVRLRRLNLNTRYAFQFPLSLPVRE